MNFCSQLSITLYLQKAEFLTNQRITPNIEKSKDIKSTNYWQGLKINPLIIDHQLIKMHSIFWSRSIKYKVFCCNQYYNDLQQDCSTLTKKIKQYHYIIKTKYQTLITDRWQKACVQFMWERKITYLIKWFWI